MTSSVSAPDILRFTERNRPAHFAGNQDWFRGFWQRKAGCGPTTGANLLYYLSRFNCLRLPVDVKDREGFLKLMEYTWDYLTPGMMGLNSTQMMQKGLDEMLARAGSDARSRALDIPAKESERPPHEAVAAFIRAGLEENSPVAFLNLNNGGLSRLESWHWVTVMGLVGEGPEAALDIFDNGERFFINLADWLAGTSRGGGFVYIQNEG